MNVPKHILCKNRVARTVVAALIALLPGFVPAVAGDDAPRPNIVLILCDDLGFSDLGCYGGEIRTPHLDRLAATGMQFTQFYNCAVCLTTRAALTTGLHPRAGMRGGLRDDMVTLGEVLRQAGYQTALIGKWHLGSQPPRRPIDRGFDEYYGLMDGACNYFNPAQRDPVFESSRFRVFAHNDRRITEFPDDYYTTDAFSDHAAEQIRRFANSRKPFFLHICFTAPHFPLHAKPEDIVRYKGKYKMGYFELRQQRYRRQLKLGIIRPEWKLAPVDRKIGRWKYDWHIKPWEDVRNPRRQEALMEVYAAMVDCMDQGIGRIIKTLEATGVTDNTLVMFLSDNGGCATVQRETDPKSTYFANQMPGARNSYTFCEPGWGWAQNTPFRRYKVWTYEGGIATPMIARWPGMIKPGTITHQVGHVVDFMPTLIELAGIRYPERYHGKQILPAEGQSLMPILRGGTRAGHDALCWYLMGNRAIRQGKWKLVWGRTRARWELYDLEADRTETNDLADRFPERVHEMAEVWQAWARRTEVPAETDECPQILREIGIPTVDISGETGRHVIVAQGTQRHWQGQPNTLLMPDGKTMFCSWQGRQDGTRKHGAPGGLLKRSDDGGLTWSDLLDVPANWREIGRGHPTIHRLVDRKGAARLFVFSRTPDRSSMLQAMSEDGGATWSPTQKNGLVCWTAPQTIESVEGGRKHLMWYERTPNGGPAPGVVWQSASTDGGLTWGDSRPVVKFAGASEPAAVRSPDGGQFLLLIREENRCYNSVYATSDDEGKTWSQPRELPKALTGDRHDGVYTPDGRLVIVFRDRAEVASTYQQFVAWVGRYEDIVEGREGQYRVKLLHAYADTGYPGIEILPDGTIVATTYAKLKRDELDSVISVRFKVDELDRKLDATGQ